MHERENPVMGRRDVLKLVWQVPFAAGMGGLIANEGLKEKRGIETDSGVFFPIYEFHNIGISPDDIPQGTDVLFREGYFNNRGLSRLAPSDVLDSTYFEQDMLQTVSDRGIKIGVGDVDVGGHNVVDEVEFKLGALAIGGGIVAKIHRRKFLGDLLLGAGLYGTSAIWGGFLVIGAVLQPNEYLRRAGVKINTLVSNLHPQDSMIFFRNIVMAQKMHTIAEYLSEEKGRKTRIAFQVGAGHGGIEDFLQVGADICRKAISLYPAVFLDEIIRENGGLRTFCSANITEVSPNYPKGTSVSTSILDKKLFKMLNRRPPV